MGDRQGHLSDPELGRAELRTAAAAPGCEAGSPSRIGRAVDEPDRSIARLDKADDVLERAGIEPVGAGR